MAGGARALEMPHQPPEAWDVLTRIADAKDAGFALEQSSPPQDGYKKLKAALADLRGKSTGGSEIADGQALKLNAKAPMEDPRVPQLRERPGAARGASGLREEAQRAYPVEQCY